jgi:putative selenate reductase
MFRELERNESIFDLPARKFVRGVGDLDLSVRFHDQRASCPLGPAAGPQTQMAQNIVLSWLAGSRILELKTVQVRDRLTIPRPCIDMRNVGYNAEWSQELLVEESLREYVKAAMLVEMLRHDERFGLAPSFGDVVYDMSVGYDLEGIRSDKVSRFIEGMLDARPVIDELRREIPDAHARLRDLDYPSELSRTITLSTFHGCPPDEIERIIDYLMRRWNVHCVVKFNPMLLGAESVRHLLHDALGYTDIRVPDSAFERDTKWPQAVEIVERLGETAATLGLGFGVKFSNTLIVENTAGFLPDSEKEVYLSGAPLHVLAIALVAKFRKRFGNRFPVSFSAGIDAKNFAEAAALGLVPITTCSDLLKPGGYGRLAYYHARLGEMMRVAGAKDLEEWTIRAFGLERESLDATGLDPASPERARCLSAIDGGSLREAAGDEFLERWASAARLLNTDRYAGDVASDRRYFREQNSKLPPHVDSHLERFDCITCDKCIPVCPNDANFNYRTGRAEIPSGILRARKEATPGASRTAVGRSFASLRMNDTTAQAEPRGLAHPERSEGSAKQHRGATAPPPSRRTGEIDWMQPLRLQQDDQIGTFADFCNECGNCDVFCPETGGPYQFKPLFFGSEEEWRRWSDRDGFHVARSPDHDLVLGRAGGRTWRLEVREETAHFSGDGFRVSFHLADVEATIDGEWSDDVDLTWCFIMDLLRRAVLDDPRLNYINVRHQA